MLIDLVNVGNLNGVLTWLATASTRVSGTSESDMMNGGVKVLGECGGEMAAERPVFLLPNWPRRGLRLSPERPCESVGEYTI